MSNQLDFIIYSRDFDPNIGGWIALHRLCDLINRAGRTAYIYPITPTFPRKQSLLGLVRSAYTFCQVLKIKSGIGFRTFPGFLTPLKVTKNNIENAVVVYPEIIAGNPLGAKNVVRWLMHKPGFWTGVVDYGPEDLVFYFQEAFYCKQLAQPNAGQLQVLHLRDDIYRQTNFGKRTGTCYILRKGAKRKPVHDLNDSTLIDGLTHEQIAAVFNRVQMCISYDPYTLYSAYAALCGCTSVVMPEDGVDEAVWQPMEELRLGIAYGFDKIDWAKSTQHRVLAGLKQIERNSNRSVNEFIRKCDEYFTR